MVSYDSSYDYFSEGRFEIEAYIRQMNDDIADTYSRINEIRRDRNNALASNRILNIERCIIYGGYALIFFVWAGLFLSGHWFVGVFIYPYIACVIGGILDVARSATSRRRYEDILRYDREISQENMLISRLQREIQQSQQELHRRQSQQSRVRSSGYNENSRRNRSNSGDNLDTTSYLKEQYEILGCTPDIDNESMKQLYRKLIKEYHPDHVAALGNGSHLVQLAEEQAKKINSAYNEILKARGIR